MVLLLPLTILTLLLTFLLLHRRRHPRHLPPSPPGLPIIGHFLQLGTLPHRSLANLAATYGDLLLLRLGSLPTLIISSSAAAHEIMKTQDLAFSSRPDSFIGDQLFYGSKDVSLAKYGEYWRQIRRICVVHLLSQRRVQSFNSVRNHEVSLLVEKINNSAVCHKPVNLSELVITLTNDVTCLAAFGMKYAGGDGAKVRELFMEFTTVAGAFPVRDFLPWLGWVDRLSGLEGKVRSVSRRMDEFFEEVIDEHKRRRGGDCCGGEDEEKSRDFVDVLLSLDGEDGGVGDGFKLDREGIKALILVLDCFCFELCFVDLYFS